MMLTRTTPCQQIDIWQPSMLQYRHEVITTTNREWGYYSSTSLLQRGNYGSHN